MYVSIILLLMVDVIPLCLAHNYWLMLLPIMFYCNKQTDVIVCGVCFIWLMLLPFVIGFTN